MSDTKSGNDKKKCTRTLQRGTLSLRGRGVSGTVRQSFSHGRTNSVVVETKKRRIIKPGDEKTVFAPKKNAPPFLSTKSDIHNQETQLGDTPGNIVGHLSAGELEARTRALEESKVREIREVERREREKEDRKRSMASATQNKQREEKKRLVEVKILKSKKEAEYRKAEEEEKARIAAADASAIAAAAVDTEVPKKKSTVGSQGLRDSIKPKQETQKTTRPRGRSHRRTKLTLSNALDDDSTRSRSLASIRRQREKQRREINSGPREKVMREVTIPDTITIQELACRMTERAVEVVKLLMQQGHMLKPGDIIDADMAQLIAEEMGHTVVRVSESDIEESLVANLDFDNQLETRPPVITIMGHVDHGKTSLLDRIRSSNVASGETGSITQNIGAYQIKHGEQNLSFIDTPGHEAFTAMRARGTQVTDIAILVVAADDSIMPQTIESIHHAKVANVPLIVAINKMDIPGANADKVRTELLQHEVFVEKMGGEILDVEISAKTGCGITSLLDTILLQSELLELKANPHRDAEGIIIEAKLEKGRGAVIAVIIQHGTLKRSDIIIAGNEWGKVRAIINDQSESIEKAGPSTPVEVLGLSGVPSAGEKIIVVENEARAREVSDYRRRKARELAVAAQAGQRGSLEQMMTNLKIKSLDVAQFVVKASTHGSIEAIIASLEKLGTDEVQARVMHSGVGGITESDVTLAVASKMPILAFNVRANKQARDMAEREGIEIRYYSIIYDLIDDVKSTLSGLLAPERRETFIGYAEILEIFNVSRIGKVAGCLITEGRVERSSGVRLLRDNRIVHEGELSTLKRFKDEVSQVQSGMECGMAFLNYQDIRKGDIIECFIVELIDRSL
ncbi:translation initiation factor IF-2 [Candidatus Endowatersipora endosymbiont of Watersipora subatra]|uniref:translation initiation factor IF-2 n=1 Tax=Candidatus Endowatersipora endosymbiont of Watersipora subatra TaxID=3077946 RepID=UPI00312C8041